MVKLESISIEKIQENNTLTYRSKICCKRIYNIL